MPAQSKRVNQLVDELFGRNAAGVFVRQHRDRSVSYQVKPHVPCELTLGLTTAMRHALTSRIGKADESADLKCGQKREGQGKVKVNPALLEWATEAQIVAQLHRYAGPWVIALLRPKKDGGGERRFYWKGDFTRCVGVAAIAEHLLVERLYQKVNQQCESQGSVERAVHLADSVHKHLVTGPRLTTDLLGASTYLNRLLAGER
ncbi:MAG: hypothetical protein GC159_16290 [Phycisphaera sp.]|nr:hypothetical protein [Phycisphaera sp.]